MLVITRRRGQHLDIKLPDGRVIMVKHCGGSKSKGNTRIGIEAPLDCRISRPDWQPAAAVNHSTSGAGTSK